jgi:hypothetical protein
MTAVNTLFYGNSGTAGRYVDLIFCTVAKNGSGLGISDKINCIVEREMTNDPCFIDYEGNDFRLASNSPCIDAASIQDAPATDLDGTPRPLDGNGDGISGYDLGAYEAIHLSADTDGDGLRDISEINKAGTNPTCQDTDGDHQGDWLEMLAGTGPLDAQSYLGLNHIACTGNHLYISWKTVHGRSYRVQRTTRPDATAWTNVGHAPVYELDDYPEGFETLVDSNAVTGSPVFYRILLNR